MTVETLYFVLALAGVGMFSGLSAGMFGIGGGAIMVPALFYTFSALGVSSDVVMHCAVATSTAVIILNAVRSVRSHNKRQSVDWDLLWPDNKLQSYAFWIGLGAFMAALWIAPNMSSEALTLLFAVIVGLTSLQFIFGRPDWKLRQTVPDGFAPPIVGSLIGGVSSLMGIGGGSITVPLMSICGVPMHKAVGTASGFGFAIAAPAVIGFIISGMGVAERPILSLGYVNVLGFVLIASTAYLCVPLGAKAAHALSARKLKLIFGICLMLVAVNMARKVLI